MNTSRHIILIGPTPPLIGGVCTHIERANSLFNQLDSTSVEVISSNPKSNKLASLVALKVMAFKLLFKRKSIVHIHVDSLVYLFIGYIASIKHEVFLTIHNNRYEALYNNTAFSTQLRWWLLKRYNAIVTVNNETQAFLNQRLNNVHEQVIPAFLPPINIEESSIEFIQDHFKKGSYDKMLAGYAYRLSFYNDEDLYGVDMMVELVRQLLDKGHNPLLVLMLNMTPNEYLDTINQRISKYGLSNNILQIDIAKGVDSVAVWKACDVYIRPTNTDGDSIAVREALYVGTQVVTSDCTSRPDGVVLFKNRDQRDFLEKTLGALDNLPLRRVYCGDIINDYALLYGPKEP